MAQTTYELEYETHRCETVQHTVWLHEETDHILCDIFWLLRLLIIIYLFPVVQNLKKTTEKERDHAKNPMTSSNGPEIPWLRDSR